MANIEVSIKIDMKPTDAGRSPDKMAEQTERGCFRLVLDEAAELDIDALEDGLLRTCYPALRDALAQHLEQAIKKKPWRSRINAAQVTALGGMGVIIGSMVKWVALRLRCSM